MSCDASGVCSDLFNSEALKAFEREDQVQVHSASVPIVILMGDVAEHERSSYLTPGASGKSSQCSAFIKNPLSIRESVTFSTMVLKLLGCT